MVIERETGIQNAYGPQHVAGASRVHNDCLRSV